ncbi:uncharacterized protein SPPG_09067 [Spizellomyces punctatus DAOM BR117]|uniref:Uncharacterized protein n=1 Tax=Spizellomyces punctatus (strain DAOM BR117) TaxID=645134 RepID=A0A0L0HLX4_SPIPD|nr:uncharacterized protein SPPG_09067 [Spizellomyces punctatus DAOM BR117]KND02436.1 hypothetical protein SPPG_09067 [Spizellomyces punctatus DAOM BR117]|eukprot:XP_016610475.1 hypothetical protein SPPG_09067 [Spizellomyces punctatus DAOM BR117]
MDQQAGPCRGTYGPFHFFDDVDQHAGRGGESRSSCRWSMMMMIEVNVEMPMVDDDEGRGADGR